MIIAYVVSPFALCIVIMLTLSFSCSNLSDAVDTAEIRPPIVEHSVDEISESRWSRILSLSIASSICSAAISFTRSDNPLELESSVKEAARSLKLFSKFKMSKVSRASRFPRFGTRLGFSDTSQVAPRNSIGL